jgi:hypothetical protein
LEAGLIAEFETHALNVDVAVVRYVQVVEVRKRREYQFVQAEPSVKKIRVRFDAD